MPTIVSQPAQQPLDAPARRAITGAFLGFFVDMFDVWLPVIVLTPAIVYFTPDHTSLATLSVVSSVVFVITLVARPIGALLFGHIADTMGRKRTAIISVSGFGVATLLIGCLPGFATWGYGSLVTLLALRFIDGFFLAGEYTSGSPLAMEYAPKARRGWYGALIMSGFPISYIAINLLTFGMLGIAPLHGLGSAYVTWGWRIPFFLGALIAFIFAFYYQKKLPESALWQRSKRSKNPVRSLFSREHIGGFLQVWILMNGFWLTSDMISAVLPGMLHTTLHLSVRTGTIIIIASEVALLAAYLAAGQISQKIGRRTFLIYAGVVALVVGGLLDAVLVGGGAKALWLIVLLTILVEVLVGNVWGLATTYINERFQTRVRASGYGLGYSLAVVLPSFYTFYQVWLGHVVAQSYTQLILLIIGCVLVIIGAAVGPETKDVDFEAGN